MCVVDSVRGRDHEGMGREEVGLAISAWAGVAPIFCEGYDKHLRSFSSYASSPKPTLTKTKKATR